MQKIGFIGVCCLTFLWNSILIGQERPTSQISYYPIKSHFYGIEDGMLSKCVRSVISRQNGRLFLVPCTYVQRMQGLNLYAYTGYHSFRSEITFPELGSDIQIIPCFEDVHGNQYGYISNTLETDQNSKKQKSLFFEFNNEEESWKTSSIIGKDGDTLKIRSVYQKDGEFYILGLKKEGLEIVSLSNNNPSYFQYPNIRFEPGPLDLPLPFLITDELFVIGSNHRSVYLINRKTDQITKIPLPKDFGYNLIIDNYLLRTPDGKFLLSDSGNGKIYEINLSDETLKPYRPSFLVSGKNIEYYLHRDAKNQFILYSILENEIIQALLYDSSGNVEDYSDVIKQLPISSGIPAKNISLNSQDFKRQVIVSGEAFGIIEVASREYILQVKTRPTRAITYTSRDEIYISEAGTYNLNRNDFSSKSPGFCNDTIMLNRDCNIIETSDNRLLCSAIDDRLLIYDKDGASCELVSSPSRIRRMVLDNENALFTVVGNSLYRFDISERKFERISQQLIDGFVNSMFLTAEGALYLGTSKGLFQYNFQSKNLDYIDIGGGINEQQIIDIYEDEVGNLWLATYSQGIKIINQENDLVQHINEDQGLSNNTVVSFLEDDSGDIWAGTYYGISILKQDGSIVGQLFETDGLINNECNRWSALKLNDGRLAFGSTTGVSIINPVEIKKIINNRIPSTIYLTQVKFQEQEIQIRKEDYEELQNTGISLPASNRNLELSYVLSNYTAPEETSFAYKFDRENEDWNYVGKVHDLSLYNLPVGKYNMLIKGIDFRGLESSNTISIPLIVKPFFYNTLWFYLLLLIPIIILALLWIQRQRLEKQRLEEEVLKRTKTIRAQSEALREMDLLKSKLYTNITHEFRTPLTVISGMAERVYEDEKAPELIKRNASTLLNLVNQMLDLRKLEAGKMEADYIQSDLTAYLSYIGESIRSMAEMNGLKYHFLAPADPIIMDFDPSIIARIVSNLLTNAIKFTPQGGDVYLQMDQGYKDESQIRILIRDNGIGISHENLEQIFDRYYQITPDIDSKITLKPGEGTGIGLALVRDLVEFLGGSIKVDSSLGQGTTFTILLPLKKEADFKQSVEVDGQLISAFVGSQYPETQEEGPADLGTKSERILIVEDNPDVIHYISACLKDNFKLYIAMNGEEGIEKAIKEIPDLIISDVMMPYTDGYELLSTLKDDLRTSHIPIILLTAKADIDSRIEGIERGADAYLAKPFNERELNSYIRQMIQKSNRLQERYASLQPMSPTEDPSIQLEDKFILKFKSLLDERLDDENFGVSSMANELHISRTQLHNKIKALTGKSVSQYMSLIRLNKAVALLKEGDLSISEVAYKVGFRDPKYFARLFKEKYGSSPSEWKNS